MDDVKVTLYNGSFDNRGQTILLSEARRIVCVGDHEFYARAVGKRVTVEEYTHYIRTKRREWMKAQYEPKEIKAQFGELKNALPAVAWSGWFTMLRRLI